MNKKITKKVVDICNQVLEKQTQDFKKLVEGMESDCGEEVHCGCDIKSDILKELENE